MQDPSQAPILQRHPDTSGVAFRFGVLRVFGVLGVLKVLGVLRLLGFLGLFSGFWRVSRSFGGGSTLM